MQRDDLCGITLLDPLLELDVCEVGPPPKLRGQRVTFTRVPAEGLIERHGLDHDEFGAVTLTDCECVLEGSTGWLRKVDRREHARDLIQDAASRDWMVASDSHYLAVLEGNLDTVALNS